MRFLLIYVSLVTVTIFCNISVLNGQDEAGVAEGAASLAFVFDITGSMYDDLVQVIEGAAKILATTLSRREKPLYNYVLVPFHDPDVGPVVVTTDPDDFQHELRNLYVQGGGDCPEMSISAIKEAIDVSLPNSFIYVFTDARSKDFYLTEEVLAMIQKKQSQVVFVLTGDCDDPNHNGYIAYEQIASTSSGQVFLLKKSQVNEVLNFVRVAVQSRKVNLMAVDVKDTTSNVFTIPIDSKLQEITISVSGSKPKIFLTDPSGNRFTPRKGLKKLLDIRNALVVNVKEPQPGVWKMNVESKGRHTIRVTGLSTTDFVAGFSRKPADDIKKTDHRPVGGVATHVLVNASDLEPPAGFSNLHLVDLFGNTLAEYPLIRDDTDPNIYTLPTFVPPEIFFYVKVSGIDDKGFRIERQTPTAITRIVPGPPELMMPEVSRGYFGLTAVLVCKVDSLVPYTVRWFKEDIQQGPELFFLESANVTLEVPGANQFAEGIYFCNATNVAGTRRIPTFLDVSEPPPSITVPQNVSVLPGENAVLTCNVFSAVDFNITWHRSDYSDRLRTSQKFVDINNGSLLVRNVQLEDEGRYVCRAMNEGGKTEKSAYIRVQVAPVAIVTPETVNFALGDTKEIICTAKGFPEPEINWLRGRQRVIVNEQVRLSEGKLTLLNMNRGDEGEYVCLATNPAGDNRARLQLNYIESPRITEYQSKVLVANGDEADLFCAAEGIPSPEIQWYKGDVQLKALAYVQISYTGQLKILGAQHQDAGEYKCVAKNEAGTDSAVVLLEIGSVPRILDGPENTGVDIGGNITLVCRADGLPTPKVFWQRKDGRKLDYGGRMKQLPTGDLFIRNLGVDDEGGYVCVTENQFGTTQVAAYLTITGIVPPLIGYMDPIIQVVQGDYVELNCQVLLGNPTPKVQWLFDGQTVENDEHITKNGDGNVFIEDVQAVHSGDYLCLASNVGGNASFIVTLEVQVPPSFDFVSPEDEKIDFNIIQGDTVVLPCNVQGDPPPMITWFKDESPISLTDYHYLIREDGSLEIYSAEAVDTGVYRCLASNDAGQIDKVLNLFVQVAPTISGDPNERFIVIENETAVLQCLATGVPQPDVTWRKNFVPFTPESDRFLFGNYGLTILETQIGDKAIYECIASNVAGEETKIITVIVQIPPVIIGKSDTEITVLKGERVSLNCENTGDPKPTVDWKKDETVLSVFDEVNGYEETDEGLLNIDLARVLHSGRYVCIVENDAGITTRDFVLTVQEPPRLPLNLTTYKDVIEDNAVILQCPASGTPIPLITWYKDDLLITGDQVGMTILEDGSLQILETEAEDSAVYTCIAENQAGEVKHEVEVKVIVPPRLKGTDPGQEGDVDNPNVIVRDNVTLVCPVEADPQPTITWLRNGYELKLSELDGKFEISSDGMNLTLFKADVTDKARYTCIAENVGGETEKSFDLDVHVPPSVDKNSASPEENVVVKDNSLYLDCPVSGIPSPTVYWYKDGEKISPANDPNIHVHADGRRLEIINARVTDTGKYTCVGENMAGSSEQDFNVDVHVPPKIDRPGEINDPEIITNESISLTCPAAGIPLPEITWYKSGQAITANSSQYTLLNDGWTLKIVSAKVADSARYTCRARNPAGEAEKAFDLDVLVPPMIERDSIIQDPKVVLNQSVIINCLVEGKPSPTIIWYKNGIQLDASVQPRYEILSGGRQLRVKQAQLSDAATFQCQAGNKAGTDSVDFQLQVQVPARIDLRRPNTNPKVVINGNVTIACPATGVPPPTIAWFKDGQNLEEQNLANIKIEDDGQELTIYGAQVEDTALYTCRASNEAGETDISYQVDVQVPPSINGDEVTKSPHVIHGQSVVLNCPVVGVPPPNILWMKGGLPIDYKSHPHYTVEADGQRLSIERSKLSDADLFTCVAANEAGSVEQNYDLDVWVPPKLDSTNLDLNTTVNKGHSRVLFCPVEGNPVPDILWLKENEPAQLDNRVEIVNDGLQLKITNATEGDTGRYTCVARNPAGQETLTYDLKVYVPPSIDESNVVYFRKVVENRTIIIECPVSGIPTPKVEWLIDGQEARHREGLKFSHNGYHLELASAQVTDSAIYTCIASNAAGELRKIFELEVQVPPKMDHEKLEKELNVIQNRSRVIFCPVTGIPEPSVIWYKDDIPLLDWPYPRLTLTSREKRLEIANTQTKDAGVYKCQATNPAGQVKQDFKLNVYVPPEISGSNVVTPVSVNKGTSVNFECEASGSPEPQLAWIKDGENIEIQENPHIRIQKQGRLLQITSSDVTDTGRYVCHAENRAGIGERMFDLEVNVPATIEGQKAGLQNVWVTINEPLTLECPAEGTPPPSITWRRQGQFIHQFGSPGLRVQDDGKKLLIISAQLLDLGDYSCYVENVAGNSTLEYFVNVYVPPTIEKGVEQVEAVVNFGAILPCESLGLPDPVISWEKNGENFPNTGLRHRMRVSGTIEFTSVRLEDAGTYRCTATNEAGNATREVKLDVQVPPRMVGRQPLYLNTVAGEGIVLPCEVTGIPSPRILWQKGTKVVSGGPGIEVIENGSLFLQKTSEADAGVYICIAQNSAGTAFGQIRLRIYTKPVIAAKRTDFVINNAQNIVLPCRATGRPRPKIIWEKNGEQITRSNAYVRLLRTGLAIPFARPEDAGTYTCIASNKAGSSRLDMKLLVQVPPQIVEGSRLLTYTVGDTADIQCAAIGIPPPTIQWLKEGRDIDTSSTKYQIAEFGNLIIRSLTEDDTGSYICSASNIAGQATQERLLRIQVPPSFIVVPQIQEVLLDNRLELRCTADGIPTPTIHWKRNDVPVQTPPSVNGRSVFIVHNVRPEDGGVYICLAQNPAGQAEVNTMVTVKVPAEILTPPGNKAVTIAERVVLTCSVGGDPPPEVIWMKNGRPVRLSRRIKQLSNGSLVIFDSTSSDAGEYKCVATNDAGTSEGVAMLTVREPPSFLIEPHDTMVNQGEDVSVDCVGIGEPTPKMDWMVGWDILQNSGRLSILPNNTLRIVAAQLSDSGTYRCLASNNLGKTFIEINITVVVHGGWSEWSSWEVCSATCGEGTELRHRLCDNPEPANQGKDCIGEPVQSRSCQQRQCPVSGNWGNWLPWEQCSVTCSDGVQLRRRLCDNPPTQSGGETCPGDAIEKKPCISGLCAVNGAWGEWSPWQSCSSTCGNGYQERIRKCDNPPPSSNGMFCQGTDVDRQRCKRRECPVDGNWGYWGHWNPCTLSCGGGTRTRARMCNDPEPRYGGLFCVGTDTQLDYCNNEPCPEHGGWSEWGDFGDCSVSCNGGLKRRFRTCSNPAPNNNGRPCIGSGEDTETCHHVPCPVDGMWSDWLNWSPCSQTCDRGTRYRSRTCRRPKHGGTACRGDNKQIMDCIQKPCNAIPTIAEGNLIGYINNIDIPAATFTVTMTPLLDNAATRVNATIRNIPRVLVPHFRHLLSVLSPVYWTTAMEVDGAYNGYSLTNGEFTREELAQYLTGEILKTTHYSKGVDQEGKLQLDIVLRGNVPDIADSQSVKITPYWEQYTQSGPDSVHVQSTRLMNVDGFTLPFASNHSIDYTSDDKTMPYLVQRMYARNLKVDIFPDRELVNFAVETSIAPGSPSNQCPDGFILDADGRYCRDDDECSRQTHCSDYCHNSVGSYYCSCPKGHTLDVDGRQCIDVDECSTQSASCSSEQQCTNTIGSFSCHVRCTRGYRPSKDGQNCIDKDECQESSSVCDQICVNRRGGYRCRCMPGYRRVSKGRCVDIDECELTNPPCEQVCANAHGSYLCSCRQGFELKSRGRCKDINECTRGNFSCAGGQDCVNSVGSYKCITMCPKGSTFTNGKCEDINECVSGKHRCYYNQKCVNTNPGYRCICPRGYRSAGPGTPCLDIDECSELTALCSYKCENTYGDYECLCAPGQVRLADRKSCAGLEFLEPARVIDTGRQQPLSRNKRKTNVCPLGWKFNAHTGQCIDINECQNDPGICQHNCSNTVGSFTCTCPPGYRVSKDKSTCEDINECVENRINCGRDRMCFNTLGEFTCISIPCPKGYQRDPIASNCVLECIDAEVACPDNARYADVIEFRTLALPSGVVAEQRLIRLTAYNQNNEKLRNTVFKILENDDRVAFYIHLEDGIGIVYTQQPLEDSHLYKIKVQAKSFDNEQLNIQYQTTFLIHIAVSAYPY